MTFSEILELSRSNQFSWILPCVLFSGVIVILLTTIIKNTVTRRIVKLALIFAFTYTAIWASFLGIQEKWRIRHEWGVKNWDSLTDKEQIKLTADGANLTLGPLIFGGSYAFLSFGLALIISSVAIKKISARDSQKELEQHIALKKSN